MKKIVCYLVFIVLFSLISNKNKAQFTFNVSPGLQFNSANFGYKVDKFVPYLGLQVLSANANLNEKGQRYDSNIGTIVPYENVYKFSGTVYMPTIGLKYFFLEINKLKLFGNASFTKIFLSGKINDSSDPEVNNDLKEEIKSIRIYGGQLSFGTEYFFDNNFSIGGEFGLRLLHLKYKKEIDDEVYNPDTGIYTPSKTTYDYRYNISPTYIKLSLCFYFGKE